jgi:two-component system, response regulator PdtaR
LESRDDVRIVFTDNNMPGSMDGIKLARAVRGRWPPVKIIVTSWFSGSERKPLPEGSQFIPKPHMSRWESSGSFLGDHSPAVDFPVPEVLSPLA